MGWSSGAAGRRGVHLARRLGIAAVVAALAGCAAGAAPVPGTGSTAGAAADSSLVAMEDMDAEVALERVRFEYRFDQYLELHRRVSPGHERAPWMAEAESLAGVAEELLVEERFELAVSYLEEAISILEQAQDL
jgi:hypothetical protein